MADAGTCYPTQARHRGRMLTCPFLPDRHRRRIGSEGIGPETHDILGKHPEERQEISIVSTRKPKMGLANSPLGQFWSPRAKVVKPCWPALTGSTTKLTETSTRLLAVELVCFAWRPNPQVSPWSSISVFQELPLPMTARSGLMRLVRNAQVMAPAHTTNICGKTLLMPMHMIAAGSAIVKLCFYQAKNPTT